MLLKHAESLLLESTDWYASVILLDTRLTRLSVPTVKSLNCHEEYREKHCDHYSVRGVRSGSSLRDEKRISENRERRTGNNLIIRHSRIHRSSR